MSNFPLQTLLAALALSLVAPAVRGDDPFPDQIPARERTEKRLQAVLGLAVELLPDGKGMKITAVADDGPAADVRHPTDPTRRAKMEEGEVIVAIDGQRIRTKRDWYDLLNESRLKNK